MTREQALKALELHAGASFQEIKQAHRDLAVVWHPDRFARHDDRLREKASERIKEINSAYDVLRSYDDGPSRPNESRTKHTGIRQGASGTEQSETQRQRSRTKNRSTGSSGEPSETRNSRNRIGRLWNRWSALARGGVERVLTPVAIAGHLIAVFLFFLFAFRDVQPAILFAVIFSLLPLIYFRWATAAESWREAITCLWRSPVSWVAVLAAGFVAVLVGFIVLGLPVIFALDWLFTKAPLAAWLLLPVAVMFYLYCRLGYCKGVARQEGRTRLFDEALDRSRVNVKQFSTSGQRGSPIDGYAV